MKNHFKYSILILLALLMTVSLVNASPATIGTTNQLFPFESTPQNETWLRVGTPANPDWMNNTDTSDSGSFILGTGYTVFATIRPSGDGLAEWTPTPSGTHYTTVDEATAVDTDYIYATADAKRDTFALTDLASVPSPAAVRLTLREVDTAAGDEKIRFILRIGGTVYEAPAASDVNPTTTATNYQYIWATNPAGGDWDLSSINSLEAGAKSVLVGAIFTPLRVTQVFVEVLYADAYFQFNKFENNSASQFPIGYVDIHIKYKVEVATVDDTYRIEYTVGTAPWNTLQAPVSGAASAIDPGGADSLGRVWTQMAEPNDASWNWTDIGNLRIRITAKMGGAGWDAKGMIVYEVWATANTLPLPPTSSTAMSIQPSLISSLTTGSTFFVDVYIAGLTPEISNLWLWTFSMVYDTNILTATEYYTYWPFTTNWGGVLNDTFGTVQGVSYSMSMTEPVGFSGNKHVAGRVYFTVDATGSSRIDLLTDVTHVPPCVCELSYMDKTTINPPLHGAIFQPPTYMSALDALNKPTIIDLTHPLNTKWHEDYPNYCKKWTLTSWEDQKPGDPGYGELSYSDQIDMTNETGWTYWFHVDAVTITIHWTFKDPDTGAGIAEPEVPMREMPTGTPEGTRWHQIYGPPPPGSPPGTSGYCRMFTITSWIDSGAISGVFDPSDQFDFQYDDEAGDPWPTHWAHLDAVSTDIVLSQKPIPPEPPIPEFPMGISLLIAVAPAIPIIYLWRTRPKKKVA